MIEILLYISYIWDSVDFPDRSLIQRPASRDIGDGGGFLVHRVVTTPPAAPIPFSLLATGEERARFHFSFTFASAERKITGSHYARHVGSFMSLSPGPSTFAISPPTFSARPHPLHSPSSSTRSRLFPSPLHPPGERREEEDIIYFVN